MNQYRDIIRTLVVRTGEVDVAIAVGTSRRLVRCVVVLTLKVLPVAFGHDALGVVLASVVDDANVLDIPFEDHFLLVFTSLLGLILVVDTGIQSSKRFGKNVCIILNLRNPLSIDVRLPPRSVRPRIGNILLSTIHDLSVIGTRLLEVGDPGHFTVNVCHP